MTIGKSKIRYISKKTLLRWCLLLAFLLAASFGLSGCKLTDEGTPTRVETKEVVNEDGTVTTVTYQYYDDPSSPKPDTGKYRTLIICVVSLAGMGVFFTTHFNRINKLKKRCTVPVSAVCTSVRKSKGDEHGLRHKYAAFNATYLYNYNGQQIESRNHEYGGTQYFIKYPINVGDHADIMVNPSDPRELYDKLAESARRSQILDMVILYGGAVVLLIIYFLK
jgi:hypothetical protein